ncbi:MAG: GNAT family N-acetyltransferase [Acidimicrobiia bacterium]
MAASPVELSIRRYADADEPAVLGLLQASLGWVPDDLHARLFEWKHRENPFGPSPGWVAVDGAHRDRIVGFRTFLRWEFEREGQIVEGVRAVDTATDPSYQGRGVFSRLTLGALDELRGAGLAFVFNTPNERSLPGYLKMGWQAVGRLPVGARPRSVRSLARLIRARTAAEKWSLASPVGRPATEVLADGRATAGLLAALSAPPGLRTRRTPAFLAWRYGFEPLAYRVLLAGPRLEDGALVFRLRRRGGATEAAICDVLVPGAERRTARRLARRVLAESGADYAVRVGAGRGFAPLPGQGPLLVWRSLAASEMPPRRSWLLNLGDVELF